MGVLDLAAAGPADLDAALDDDARFRSPVTEYRGRAAVGHVLSLVGRVLREVVEVEHGALGDATTTAFTARAGDRELDGIVVERRGADGRIAEVTLFLRPYSALRHAMSEMAGLLETDPIPGGRPA